MDTYDSDENSDSETMSKRKNNETPTSSKKVKRNNANDLYRQPTAEELNSLKETEHLFNSNLFRLQVDELLSEIKPEEKYAKLFDVWYKDFADFLKCVKEVAEIDLGDFDGVDVGECGPCVFKFEKPKSTFVFNSWRFIPSPELSDYRSVAIVVPKTTFYLKDYVNYRYFLKKLTYIQHIQNYLGKFDGVATAETYDYLGNRWLPVIKLVPKYSDKVEIHVFVIPEEDTFKLNRFLPNKNNVKHNVLTDYEAFNMTDYTEKGTNLYNTTLLHDLTLQSNTTLIESNLKLQNAIDAIKLLTFWAKRRNLTHNFTVDLIVHFINYLYTKRKINKHMSSYQVVRIFWSFIATLKDTDVLSINDEVKVENMNVFSSLGSFVLLDATGYYNVAGFLDEDVFKKIVKEAQEALKELDCSSMQSFRSLFIVNSSFTLQYDAVIRIKLSHSAQIYQHSTQDERQQYYGYKTALITATTKRLLKQGLTTRILELIPLPPSNEEIAFGLNLDEQHCTAVIEKGPGQFEPGAEEFKNFWGDRAELRRFKDSSICEAVYFEDAKTVQDKRLIFAKIVDYVLGEKLEVKYDLFGAALEEYVSLKRIDAGFPMGSNEEAVLRVKASFNELNGFMRELKLVLPITAIQGISDVFSYTDLFPPLPIKLQYNKKQGVKKEGEYFVFDENFDGDQHNTPHYVKPIECVIQLAMHSKWPRELKALRAMKLIYMHEIAKLLKSEHSIKSIVKKDHMDVFYSEFVFRMILYHQREIVLIKESISEDGVTSYVDTEESIAMEYKYDVLPKITGALNGLQQQFPSFGPATCLAKRWLRSQLIDDFNFPDVVINLLNAYLFLNPYPYKNAVLPQVAFLRFLKFLSEFDFELHPIIVNFNDNLTRDEVIEIESKFLQNQKSVFIVTPFDAGNSIFTKNAPSVEIMRRVKLLAGFTVEMITNNAGSLQCLFTPNLKGYDLIINILKLSNPLRYQKITDKSIRFSNDSTSTEVPIVDFNPLNMYLKELRNNYSDYALFFHDTYGGFKIGVLWKRKALESAEFKITTVNAKKCTKGDRLILNSDALIEDFYTLGNGLVHTINVTSLDKKKTGL